MSFLQVQGFAIGVLGFTLLRLTPLGLAFGGILDLGVLGLGGVRIFIGLMTDGLISPADQKNNSLINHGDRKWS